MESKYKFSEDYKELCDLMAPILANYQNQAIFQFILQAIVTEGNRVWNENESDERFKVTKLEIPSADQTMIPVQVMEKQGEHRTDSPCLIYYHGGGWIFPFMVSHLRLVREYIERTCCKVVCVNYRLVPDFPFPKGLEDCYSTLLWTHENAQSLGIDPTRIVVGGDSAGGHYSAVVSLMARDKNGPAIAGQMMTYPATDARMDTESMKLFTDTPMWNAPMTELVYKLYLANGDFGMRPYFSPIEAESLKNLPRAYIEVADIDCLRDEGIEYAEALKAAGVDVQLHKTIETIHGFDYLTNPNKTIEESFMLRTAFLNSIWRDCQ